MTASGEVIQGWVHERWGNRTVAEGNGVGFSERYWMSLFWAAMATVMSDTVSAVSEFSTDLFSEQVVYLFAFMTGTLVVSVIIGQVSEM
jgi:hypothetical protein